MASAPMQQNPAAVNAQLRAALLATAIRMRKDLGAFTSSTAILSSTTRVKLFNVGILTNIVLDVQVPVTIGTATATLSPRAPYSVISRVRLTDYDGTDRVNLSGFQLYVLNCVRKRIPYGWNNGGPIFDSNGSTEKSGIITNPAQAVAVASSTLRFMIEVPVAYDPEADLRGAILSQTNVGEMYLTIDWCSSFYANADDDQVFNGAATTTVVANGAATVEVFQEYLLPQALQNGMIPLPPLDLATVYELNGNVRSSDNLANGTEKLINYPNVRSVIGMYANMMNNSIMSATNISKFRIIANGNNVMTDATLQYQQIMQRNYLGGDIAKGTYFFLHRTKPIETALFGNVQLGVTPNAAITGTAFIEFATESFYTKGMTLPGVSQG